VELKRGGTVKVTTDASFNEKGSSEVIYVDYANICRVVAINSRVYVDDGLISLVVKEIGKYSWILQSFTKHDLQYFCD
jgi:pyruvate kinase